MQQRQAYRADIAEHVHDLELHPVREKGRETRMVPVGWNDAVILEVDDRLRGAPQQAAGLQFQEARGKVGLRCREKQRDLLKTVRIAELEPEGDARRACRIGTR